MVPIHGIPFSKVYINLLLSQTSLDLPSFTGHPIPEELLETKYPNEPNNNNGNNTPDPRRDLARDVNKSELTR